MNEQKANRLTNVLSLQRVVTSVARAHLLGAVVSATLILCIIWVGALNQNGTASIQVGDTVMDVQEAAALVENADQWRLIYTSNFRQANDTSLHAKEVAEWLPEEVDWSQAEQQIRTHCQATELRLLSLKPGERRVGTRVGVLVARCDVQGPYIAVCRFLASLNDQSHPIACSEIVLHRIPVNSAAPSAVQIPDCRATLTLGIPYAAPGTAAGKLRLAENDHAS